MSRNGRTARPGETRNTPSATVTAAAAVTAGGCCLGQPCALHRVVGGQYRGRETDKAGRISEPPL